MGDDEREVYPNAPVALVALEVRHSPIDPLNAAQRRLIKERLTEHTPVMRSAHHQQITLVQPPGGTPTQDVRIEEFPRYVSRELTTAVSVRTDTLVVETTDYIRWERVRSVAAAVLEARQETGKIDAVERVGLRYIDEIRVPDPETQWSEWVHDSLIGPAAVGLAAGLTPLESQGVMAFQHSPAARLILRYGPREGFAVDPNGELRRPTPTPGPFFLIDIDCFWTPTAHVPEFSATELLAVADNLHAPVRDLFERLITEKLRTEVLRHA
ncbi:MAG: TIGR04255 family protein [Sporichthyaceae bacterium]